MFLRFRRFCAAVFLIFAAAAMPAPARADDGGMLERVLDDGALRVGISSFVPWAMRAKDGGLIGFEVDVARALAGDMGVRLELVPTAWDGIIPALLAKKFDIIVSGMFITPERNLQVNFTDFYDKSGLAMVANRALAADLKTLADYNRGDVVFALRRGAFPVTYVRETFPDATIRQFDDEASAKQEVLNGRAHALVAAEPQPVFFTMDYPEQLFLPFGAESLSSYMYSGMAVRKGDADALNFLNNWIFSRHASGWFEERRRYWFGGRDWAGLIADE